MFRFWLLFVTGITLSAVLVLSLTLFLGAREVEADFHAYRVAQTAYDRYEQVAHEAYRYFKARIERIATGQSREGQDITISRERLIEAMTSLRLMAIAHADQDKGLSDELERVASVTSFLEESQFRFDEIEHRLAMHQGDAAKRALTQFSLEEIDEKFQPLMDGSIHRQHLKALEAQASLEALMNRFKWFSVLAGLLAAMISLLGGSLLSHRLQVSISGLMAGTRAIASGHLDTRIKNQRRDEFGILAANFNQMATTLELQRDALHVRQSELEERVLERTEELQSLNEDLTRMDEDRRRFLADVSHELRTPITVIRGEAEIALRGAAKDPDPYRLALRRIVELSVQLGTYVSDLLLTARAEEPARDTELYPVDIRQLAKVIVKDLMVLGQNHSLEVQLTMPEGDIWVAGDAIRLRQALFILGDNACRYSYPQGVVKIQLQTTPGWVFIDVIDEGIGIPPHESERIFERSFRGSLARQQSPDGQGLGLTMVRSILETHGGRIDLMMKTSQGTTFRVHLPLTEAEAS